MANIGSFKKASTGYVGTLETLSCTAKLSIKPAAKNGDSTPDFRVFKGAAEVGAAWSRTSEKGNGYLSIRLTDHATGHVLDCRLHETEQGYILVSNDK